MFQPGELVFYGNTGVCRVEEVTRLHQTGPDREKLYYRLKPLQQDGVIYTPVEHNSKVVIRPVMTRAEAEALIDRIPELPSEAYHSATLQSLAQHYQEMLGAHSGEALLALMRSIYTKRAQAKAHKRRLGMVDERFFKQAERLLYGELAAALEIPEDQVEDYITRRIEKTKQEKAR